MPSSFLIQLQQALAATPLEPLAEGELQALADALEREDQLIKQTASLAAAAASPETDRLCRRFLGLHQQHYQALMNTLQQHQALALGGLAGEGEA
ncbi:hypothetical protein J31TS4_33810 [Paenibacillus sp. J31TS4]|uniref:hypothetical protein n=1 Tax=Paenibacillus sp. J31TS4 TaxID=2807195 RepID=UPI001B168A14|nr:hypothetical protein [Paenibacillus sp. J31TS4]GIP40101.1 hypothetical protein J31TS4_33810 [Paenibacillus sp. J31TS4]